MEKWQAYETIIIWLILFGLILMVLLIFFAMYMKVSSDKIQENLRRENQMLLTHQKSLLDTFIRAQEEERVRIASDIHDDLIGKLLAVKILLEKIEPQKPLNLLTNAIELARNISHNLRDPWVEFQQLESLMDDLLDPWRSKLQILYRMDVRVDEDLQTDFKIQILRIVQELMVNVDKHASASIVKVLVRRTKNSLAILLSDNGTGFDARELSRGMGLGNIESRVQYLKGKYKIKSIPKKGTSVFLCFCFRTEDSL